MASDVTDWYPISVNPAREGWYELHSGDRLHWDGRDWGTWFADRPGVRFVINIDTDWRWRGRAQP